MAAMGAAALAARSFVKAFAVWMLERVIIFGSWVFGSGGDMDRDRVPTKITVLAFWGIGDGLFLVPLLRALKRTYPSSELELVGKAFLKDLFRHEPSLETITVYAPPWTALSGKYRFWSAAYHDLFVWLRRRRCQKDDWIVTTRGDIREHIFAAIMRGSRRFGYGQGGGSRLLTDSFPASRPLARRKHFVDYSREIASFVGCKDGHGGPQLVILEGERLQGRDLLFRSGFDLDKPMLGLHVGATFHIRQWGPDRFQEVLETVKDRLGGIVLLADPQGFWRRVSVPSRPRHLVFEGNLREVCVMLSQLDILLCNDSGIMHAAAALNVTVVAPFGPTSPDWFRPYGNGHQVIRNEELTCGPCVDRCRFGAPLCIRSVKTERVSKALTELLDTVMEKRSVSPHGKVDDSFGS